MSISSARDLVVQLSPTKFLTFNSRPHQGIIRCHNKKEATAFSAHQVSEVDLEPGCWAQTEAYQFAAGDSIKTRPWSLQYQWPTSTGDIVSAQIQLERFRHFRDTAIINTVVPTKLSEAQKWVQNRVNAFPIESKHLSWVTITNSTVLVIVLTAVSVLTVYQQWSMHRRTTRPQEHRDLERGVNTNNVYIQQTPAHPSIPENFPTPPAYGEDCSAFSKI